MVSTHFTPVYSARLFPRIVQCIKDRSAREDVLQSQQPDAAFRHYFAASASHVMHVIFSGRSTSRLRLKIEASRPRTAALPNFFVPIYVGIVGSVASLRLQNDTCRLCPPIPEWITFSTADVARCYDRERPEDNATVHRMKVQGRHYRRCPRRARRGTGNDKG